MEGLSDPLLSQVQATCPTMFVGGYPVLDDGTLAWPGLTLFLLGRTAMLSIGPAAGIFSPPPAHLTTLNKVMMSCKGGTHSFLILGLTG